MSVCCVSGCKNRRTSTGRLKLYRIPSGNLPLQANRRRLWLQAIQDANGGAEGLKGNVHVCGAHFVSGEASMDRHSPDFVPSVFPRNKPSPRKKVKRFYGRRRRRRHKVNAKTEEMATPPGADSPADLEMTGSIKTESDHLEEMQTPPTSPVPAEGETLAKEAEAETETTTMKSPSTAIPRQTFGSYKIPAGITRLDWLSPVVLLKPLVAPTGGYECEQCSQTFTGIPQLVKHKHLHEEETPLICEICGKPFTSGADLADHQRSHPVEPSFPCNVCDRSFTTSHNLKRHKLTHVKDGRKCGTCGVLFCQRHNHVLFLPQAEPVTKTDEDSSDAELQNVGSVLKQDDVQPEKSEQSQADEQDGDTESAPPDPAPSSQTFKALLQVSHTETVSKNPALALPESPSVPRLPAPVPEHSRKPGTSSKHIPPLPRYRAALLRPPEPPGPPGPQHPELPSSLKLFSPRFLTSAFLEVQRNYDYILSKSRDAQKDGVKAEKCEQSLNPPDGRTVEQVKKRRIAYDLEIVV